MRQITFPDIDAATFEKLKANVKADLGLDLPGNSGKSKAKGIEYSYEYNPDAKTLTIIELSRSFYDPSENSIAEQIQDGVDKELGRSSGK